MARKSKALGQGWRKEAGAVYVAHREHNVSTSRRKRNKLGMSMPIRGRNTKSWNRWKQSLSKDEIKTRLIESRIRARDRQQMSPQEFREKYPRETFRTNAFAAAFEAAGIHVSHEK